MINEGETVFSTLKIFTNTFSKRRLGAERQLVESVCIFKFIIIVYEVYANSWHYTRSSIFFVLFTKNIKKHNKRQIFSLQKTEMKFLEYQFSYKDFQVHF